jgi:hypothetical protein
MNLNNPSQYNTIYIRSSRPCGYDTLSRTKRERQAILKTCKKEGKEENLGAFCSHCRLTHRKCAKKDITNPHYGCIEKCCAMLHYWNMCTFCIQDTHYPVSEDPTEVSRFQRGVSKLPDDVQRYISEFVPQVFSFVRSFGKLRRNGQFFASLEKHLNLPKSTWDKAHWSMIVVFAAFRLSKNASRQKICDTVKHLYKEIYQINSQQLREDDFWPHTPFKGIGFHSWQIQAFEEIQTLFTKKNKK